MKKTIKLVNNFFISIILTFTYIIVFGISWIVLKLINFTNRKKEGSSFWVDAQETNTKLDDLRSAY